MLIFKRAKQTFSKSRSFFQTTTMRIVHEPNNTVVLEPDDGQHSASVILMHGLGMRQCDAETLAF